MSAPPPPPKKMGLSLYADLLEPGKDKQPAGATISGAPVKYNIKRSDADEELAAKKKDASLQFQPIRRPQAQQKKPKAPSSSAHKFSSSVATATTATASSPDKQLPASTPASQQPSVQRSNFEDWVGDDDDGYYDRPKYERGGRKKKKKNKQHETRAWDWDDIYDPTLPNNYADYKGSEEQVREIRDWKARLYYHRLKDAKNSNDQRGVVYSDDEEEYTRKPVNRMFAPPPNLSFAPPSFDDAPRQTPVDDDDEYYPPVLPPPPPIPHAVAPAPVTMAASIPTPSGDKTPAQIEAKRAEAAVKIAAFKAKLAASKSAGANGPSPSPIPSAVPAAVPSTAQPTQPVQSASPSPPPPPPPEESSTSISRAPVRYQVPPPPTDLPAETSADITMGNTSASPANQQEVPRSNRPGQKGFAERLMKKYGWEKGQGLGAQGEGITTAIFAKQNKRKKLPDAQGGGWAAPANMGKIVGGKKRKIAATSDDDGTFGQMSEVIKLDGMLTGLDVDQEIQKDQSLFQEIGEEMEKEYGKVERVFVWRAEMGGNDEVFVKFTSQLSALRAVNATDGMTFAGNDVVARFFPAEKFERGEYV